MARRIGRRCRQPPGASSCSLSLRKILRLALAAQATAFEQNSHPLIHLLPCRGLRAHTAQPDPQPQAFPLTRHATHRVTDGWGCTRRHAWRGLPIDGLVALIWSIVTGKARSSFTRLCSCSRRPEPEGSTPRRASAPTRGRLFVCSQLTWRSSTTPARMREARA